MFTSEQIYIQSLMDSLFDSIYKCYLAQHSIQRVFLEALFPLEDCSADFWNPQNLCFESDRL